MDHVQSGLATCGICVTCLVGNFSSMFWVDRAGRRTLLLISYTGMMIALSSFTVCMILAGGPYDVVWAKFAGVGCIFLYVAANSVAASSVTNFLPTELFPQDARAAALTLTGLCNAVLVFVTVFLFPIVMFILESYTFLIFVASVAVATVYLMGNLPETKGKTIDEIQTLLRLRLA